jgi:hypothetical protein
VRKGLLERQVLLETPGLQVPLVLQVTKVLLVKMVQRERLELQVFKGRQVPRVPRALWVKVVIMEQQVQSENLDPMDPKAIPDRMARQELRVKLVQLELQGLQVLAVPKE